LPKEGFKMGTFIAKNKEINFLYQNSERIFRELVENIHLGIFMADMKGKLFFVNSAFVSILGYKNKDAILGKNIFKNFFTKLHDSIEMLKKMEKLSFVRDRDVEWFSNDGSRVFLSLTCNYIRDEKRNMIGYEGIIDDVTEKKKLQSELMNEKDKISKVLRFDENLSSFHSRRQMMDFAVAQITRILGAGRCSLMLQDAVTRELTIHAAKGLREEVIKKTRIKGGTSISGEVLEKGLAILVDNIEYDKRFYRANKPSYDGKSFISVPIKIKNKYSGVVNVTNNYQHLKRAFSDIDLRILQSMSRALAIAIENVQ